MSDALLVLWQLETARRYQYVSQRLITACSTVMLQEHLGTKVRSVISIGDK